MNELPDRLRALADQMIEVAAEMDYYGGFGEVGKHGRELAGAAHVMRTWADGIAAEQAERAA